MDSENPDISSLQVRSTVSTCRTREHRDHLFAARLTTCLRPHCVPLQAALQSEASEVDGSLLKFRLQGVREGEFG